MEDMIKSNPQLTLSGLVPGRLTNRSSSASVSIGIQVIGGRLMFVSWIGC